MRRALLIAAALFAGCGGAGSPEPAATPRDPDAARLADLLRAAREREGGGNAAASEAAWEEVLALRPRNPGALYATARLRRDRGDLAGALVRLETLRTEEPVAGRGFLLAAEILADSSSGALRDTVRAEAFAREAIARNPEESGSHLGLGRVLLLAGRAEEAAERLAVAARMNPRDAESRSLLGAIRLRAGRQEEARIRFREALLCGRGPGVGSARADIPGEGDTGASLEPGRRPGGGELRAAAGLAALGEPVGGAREGGAWPGNLREAARAALAARGTGEALLDRDADGRPAAAAVEGPQGPAAAAVSPSGEVLVYR